MNISRLKQPTVAVPAAVGLVFFVAGVVQLVAHWSAIGDWAVAELIVRHVGRHVPLSGPYSAERGYNHPLPWVYALEWFPYHLFGSRPSAAPAMALWWSGAWATFIVWLLARRDAMALGLVALASLLIMGIRVEGGVLVVPWNPYLAVVPAFALVFVSWRVATGEARLLPLSVGLAVWCAGAHLGFLPFAAALVLASSLSLVIVTRSAPPPRLRGLVRPALIALAVASMLVTPMLLDAALHGSESNPARIVQEAGRGSETVPAAQAVKVLRAELAIPPTWTRTAAPYDVEVFAYNPPARVPLLLVVIAFAAIAAGRRRARDELLGIALGLIGLVASIAALIRLDDTLLKPWYLLSAHVSSAALVSFVVWSSGRSIVEFVDSRRTTASSDSPRSWQRRLPIVVPVLCLLVTAIAVANMRSPRYFQTVESTTARLLEPVEQRFPKGTKFVVSAPLEYDGYFSQSFTLQLDRAGYDVRVPNEDLFMYTSALAVPKQWRGTGLTVQLTEDTPSAPHPRATLITSARVPQGVPFQGQTLSIWQDAAEN